LVDQRDFMERLNKLEKESKAFRDEVMPTMGFVVDENMLDQAKQIRSAWNDVIAVFWCLLNLGRPD